MKLTMLAGVAILLPIATWAADTFDVKPGLWETTTNINTGAGGPPPIPPDKLAQLPPAQRAQIEAMMKPRTMTSTSKICMTKESLAKGMSFSQNNQKDCTQKITSQTSSKVEVHMECKGDFTGAGDLVVERLDSEHAKGNMVMKGTGGRAMGTNMTLDFTTKFLSSDCGDVKPIGDK